MGETIKKAHPVNAWVSSYGIMTAIRLLKTYDLHLAPAQLLDILKQPHHFYKDLLEVPTSNLLNNLLLEQVYRYQLLLQKLFIDYLLNQYVTPNEDEMVDSLTADLNEERQSLIEKNEGLYLLEIKLQALIAESQSALIGLVSEYIADNTIDYQPTLNVYLEKAVLLQTEIKSQREYFYNTYLRVDALLKSLPVRRQAITTPSDFTPET